VTFDQVLGASTEIFYSGMLCLNSQVMIKGGKQFGECDRTVDGFATQSVRRTDDLAGFHATTKQNR